MPSARILVHENSFLKLLSIEESLQQKGFDVVSRRTNSRNEFANALADFQPNLVLCDYDFAGLRAVEALSLVRESAPEASFIVLSDVHGEELAVECMKNGATDYVFKDRPERLIAIVLSAVEKQELIRDRQRLERQHELLFQSMPDFVCILNVDGSLVDANPAWSQRLGFARDEWLGRSLAELVLPVDRPTFTDWWQTVTTLPDSTEETPTECEVRMIARTFASRYVTWTARLHAAEHLVYASGHDTNDRHVAEASLRESEARFRAMADSAPAFIWIADADESRTYCNRPWLEFTGRTLELELGMGWTESIHPDDLARSQKVYAANFSAKRAFKTEYRLRRADGQYRWLLDNGSPHHDHRGVMIGFIGSCIDISDQHEAETRLTHRAIKQAALAGFGRFALAQHAFEDLLREATRSICDTLRVEISQVLALSPHDDVLTLAAVTGLNMPAHPTPAGIVADAALSESTFFLSDRPDIFPARETHAGRKIAAGFAVAISSARRPFGFLTALSTSPQTFSRDSIDFIEGIANILGSVHQRELARTALEESERKLLQSQKMEAVGILAGGVAHDFNNLLTAIRCYGDLLNEDLAEVAPQLQPKAAEILKATARASALTRQLLAFSRKQILQPEILDLNNVVTDLKELVRSLLSENVVLNVNPTEMPVYFEADRNQVDQVVINLCINARDAMPHGGTISIEIGSRWLHDDNSHGLASGDYAVLQVSDTGIGMPPEVQAKLFQPFFTTKPKGRGTGLGLATCAVIVKSSQGAIYFESAVGRGTTFSVLLPQLPALSFSLSSDEDSAVGEGTERILLVEDDEAIRTVTTAILESLGYGVVAVPGGAEALELCGGVAPPQFDLLLTDIVMPNMDGRELAERISKLCPKIRIMFMSGYVGDATILQAVQDAGARFLEKPFTRASLARKVREAFEPPARTPTL